jgi:hypothetical protein
MARFQSVVNPIKDYSGKRFCGMYGRECRLALQVLQLELALFDLPLGLQKLARRGIWLKLEQRIARMPEFPALAIWRLTTPAICDLTSISSRRSTVPTARARSSMEPPVISTCGLASSPECSLRLMTNAVTAAATTRRPVLKRVR